MNQFSYYHASGSGFASSGPIKCGPRGAVCLGANLSGTGSMDLFIDANILTWTSPFKILGANYGLNLIVPFAIVDASGSASLQPVLSLPGRTTELPSAVNAGGSTKGSIGDIYVEPLNLGWHFKQFDAMLSSGLFAPSGPYNADAKLNVGFGHWTGVFGLGGVAYADVENTWSLSIYSHYLLYASQIGRNYTLSNVVPFEWGAAKTINLNGDIIKQVTIGAIGYAQWQVTNNSIGASPTTKPGTSIVDQLNTTKAQILRRRPWHQPADQIWILFFAMVRRVRCARNAVGQPTHVQCRPASSRAWCERCRRCSGHSILSGIKGSRRERNEN